MRIEKTKNIFLIIFLISMVDSFAQPKFEKYNLADPQSAIEIKDSIIGPHNVASGYGLYRDFNSGVHEDNSIWFKFKVNRDTLLTFDIVPLNNMEDYDFILFKYNSDKTIDSIRDGKRLPERVCFSQNTSKNSSTGLSEFATATLVGSGPGAAYVPALKVKTGERYYLMVNYGDEYIRGNPGKIPAGFMIYFYNYWSNKKPTVLKNVLFETNKSVLLESSFPELDKLTVTLKQNSLTNIEIRGHTDNVGDPASNQLLSEQRAHAVVDYLISKGIDKKRLLYKGLGSKQPVASNKTEEGRKKNRRVEFAVIMK
jgi:outer membrane protein OmpA-like peptidoglycan-associated protein